MVHQHQLHSWESDMSYRWCFGITRITRLLECGPRGPGRPWRPLSSDRMQNLVEFRGSSFLRNADSELKIQECRPNLSCFLCNFSSCAGLEIVDKTHKDGF